MNAPTAQADGAVVERTDTVVSHIRTAQQIIALAAKARGMPGAIILSDLEKRDVTTSLAAAIKLAEAIPESTST